MSTNGVADASAEDVTKLAAEVSDLVKDYKGIRDTQRKNEIRAKAKAIIAATQDPDTQWEDHIVQFAELGAIRQFVHLGAFALIPREGSISYNELAEKLKADPRLISRMGSILVATHVLKLHGTDRISHTPLSAVYLDRHPPGLMTIILYDEMNVPCGKWPDYFDKHGLKETGDSFELTPHTFAWNQTDKNWWQALSDAPERFANFNDGMSLLEHVQPCLGMYDFGWLAKLAESDKERTLLVDVGGGRGTTLQTIIEAYPGIDASRCVLQERPDVLEHARQSEDPVIKALQKHPIDFFKESPVQGAAAYYIRRCLHDWSDDFCVTILSLMRKSMASDSKLFITEQVLAHPPIAHQIGMDICVCVVQSSR